METELEENSSSQAFDGFEFAKSDSNEEISYWKLLSVDLEKRKVVLPDWTKAKHFPGVIIKCTVTRNKERLYDIDYHDGSRLIGVREEHIHWIAHSDDQQNKGDKHGRKVSTMPSGGGIRSTLTNDANIQKRSTLVALLQEGVRVHAKIILKSGKEVFVPGRINKVHRGTYDVECEGGKEEFGLPIDDVMLGLEEGSIVEARRPNKVYLQCTGVSWNSTGSSLAVSYGKVDISGWCDYPGAVCMWNVFSKSFDATNPDVVLDHNSCIICVKCHPIQPAIVAGGSFNGEIIVWDLTLKTEQVLAMSSISEYGHKEPILDLDWLYDSPNAEWLLVTVGADGRILFWSLKNKLSHPVKGVILSSTGRRSSSHTSRDTSRGKQYQSCHSGSCISFGSGTATATGGGGNTTVGLNIPKWYVVGGQGGNIVRGQTLRTLRGASSRLTVVSCQYVDLLV